VVETMKERLAFDKEAGKPTHKTVAITNTQNEYNIGMGFVDLGDLLAWFYRHARSLPTRAALILRARALAHSHAHTTCTCTHAHMLAHLPARSLT
jgi:hypothetical protein